MANKELRTFDEFRQARLDDTGFIVIKDIARPAIVHKLNGRCVSPDNFKVKVMLGDGQTGKYFWVDKVSSAALEFGASPCRSANRIVLTRTPGNPAFREPGAHQINTPRASPP